MRGLIDLTTDSMERDAMILAEQRATERRVTREGERREFNAAKHAATQKLSQAKPTDVNGVEFTAGASLEVTRAIPYIEGHHSVRFTMPGTRGEIITIDETPEVPRAAIQFDGRDALHVMAVRDLRVNVKVVHAATEEVR